TASNFQSSSEAAGCASVSATTMQHWQKCAIRPGLPGGAISYYSWRRSACQSTDSSHRRGLPLSGDVMAATDLVLAFTGASGSPYGVRLLEVLLRAGRTVHLTLSPAGAEVLAHERDRHVRLDQFELTDLLGDAAAGVPPDQVQYHDYRDFR